jgi:SAM domain (Sterile alpha motif)
LLAFQIARKSLRRLGLEEYEAAFRKNEIDESVLPDITESVLPDITEDHLRELGFSLGDTYT